MPLIPLPDGTIYHSRSLSHAFGTHSLQHFQAHGVHGELVPQSSKFVYVGIIDPTWGKRLKVPVLTYPKREVIDAGG